MPTIDISRIAIEPGELVKEGYRLENARATRDSPSLAALSMHRSKALRSAAGLPSKC
jgi:hypothetical protein